MPSNTMERAEDMAMKLSDCWLFKRRKTSILFLSRPSKHHSQQYPEGPRWYLFMKKGVAECLQTGLSLQKPLYVRLLM